MKTNDRASFAAVRDAARATLRRGSGGRWTTPGGGLLDVECPEPFLVVGREDAQGTMARLTGGMSSRLVLPADDRLAPGFLALATAVIDELSHQGPLVVIGVEVGARDRAAPGARLVLPPTDRWDSAAARLQKAFEGLEVAGEPWCMRVSRGRAKFVSALLEEAAHADVWRLAVELAPVFRRPGRRGLYPMVLDEVRQALHAVISAVVDAIAKDLLPERAARPRLGVARLDRAARRSDAVLCAAANAYEVLVQLTPANLHVAWQRLLETDFTEEPRFRYRPLPHDPVVLKRAIFEAPVDEVEDPFVAELLRDKQEELDRTFSMLRDRGQTFLHESEQIFGRPDAGLCDVAARILDLDRSPMRDDDGRLDTATIVERAREHMLGYRDQDPLFPDELEVRDDIAAGLMVSRGRLLVREGMTASTARLEALLEHEVGTHVVTWFNGSAQPLRLLGDGLAGYEMLQEGLAVLAEHLAGGLDRGRMRVLAARVIAADAVADGATFLEIFHRLCAPHGLSQRSAFQITVRATRGGGLTKDLAYLRGLLDLVDHVRQGNDLEPLYVGKIGLRHLPIVKMLHERGVIGPPRVLPRVLSTATARARIEELRAADSAIDAVVAMAGGSA